MHVLIIGVAGTGKSYLANRLRKRCVAVFDEGSASGLTKIVDGTGRKAKYCVSKDFWKTHFQVLDTGFLKKILKENETIYVLGDAGGKPGRKNGSLDVTGMFDRVYYLYAPKELIRKRLQSRTSKRFGKDENELKGVFGHKRMLDKRARELGIRFIDAALPGKEIINGRSPGLLLIVIEPECFISVHGNHIFTFPKMRVPFLWFQIV